MHKSILCLLLILVLGSEGFSLFKVKEYAKDESVSASACG